MDIKLIRKKTDLDQRAFAHRLAPHLKGFSLDEFMLNRMEKGEPFREDRMNAIHLAITRAFPEHVAINSNATPAKRRKVSFKISGLLLGSVFFFFFLISMAAVYLFIPKSVHLENFERFITAIGTSVTVIGVLFGLYYQFRK